MRTHLKAIKGHQDKYAEEIQNRRSVTWAVVRFVEDDQVAVVRTSKLEVKEVGCDPVESTECQAQWSDGHFYDAVILNVCGKLKIFTLLPRCFRHSWNVHPAWCLNKTHPKNICSRQY